MNWSDRESVNKYMRDYCANRVVVIKNSIFNLLGDSCPCGIDDRRVLEIDHKNGGGNKIRKTSKRSSLNYYTRILREIEQGSEEYRILCRNCNWIAYLERKEETKMFNLLMVANGGMSNGY